MQVKFLYNNRNFLERKECSFNFSNTKINKKDYEIIKKHYLTNKIDIELSEEQLINAIWKSEKEKHDLIELEDAKYFGDLEYFPKNGII